LKGLKERKKERKRGQAFETMMLVISVIVAVAILGILLGFIGGIGTFGANAKTVIPDLMKKVANKGYGIEVKDNVEFTAGDIILLREAIGEAPISEDNVAFKCTSNAGTCGSGKPLEVDESTGKGKITVTKKISASIAVCTDGSKYRVFVGDRGAAGLKATSEACLKEVGIS